LRGRRRNGGIFTEKGCSLYAYKDQFENKNITTGPYSIFPKKPCKFLQDLWIAKADDEL